MESRTELQAVADYKKSSDIYKNAIKSALLSSGHQHDWKNMVDLSKATSFSEMIKIIYIYDIDNAPAHHKLVINAVSTIGGFF